jgi:hypothetical protein
MTSELRRQIADVLEDYRNGLLDSADDGVDRILELIAGTGQASDQG